MCSPRWTARPSASGEVNDERLEERRKTASVYTIYLTLPRSRKDLPRRKDARCTFQNVFGLAFRKRTPESGSTQNGHLPTLGRALPGSSSSLHFPAMLVKRLARVQAQLGKRIATLFL